MLILNVYEDIVHPYEGYPAAALIVMGVAVATLAIVADLLLQR